MAHRVCLGNGTLLSYSLVPILISMCCSIYLYIYQAFLEDAFGDRVWVDDEESHDFVENILTVFNSGENPLDKKNIMKLEDSEG